MRLARDRRRRSMRRDKPIFRVCGCLYKVRPHLVRESLLSSLGQLPSIAARGPATAPHAGSESQDPILSFLRCDPPGIPRLLLLPFPMQIVQIPGQVMMLFEYDHFIRQIFFDRRTHPGDLDPTWLGDSVGHWEGNTLVVDTVGLNDKTWLDQVGHPHSDALHVVERIHRVDHDTLTDDLVIDDPKAYTKSWKGQQTFKLKPAWHLMEYVCEDTLNRSNP